MKRQTVWQDFATVPAEALVNDSAGNLVSIGATAGPLLGTFTIDGLPDGEYILHSGSRYMVTSSSSPDLGTTRGGRPDIIPLGNQSSLIGFHLSSLKPWQSGDLLELFSTEADDWDFGTERFTSLSPNQTTVDFTFDLRNLGGGRQASLIEGSKGDHLYVAQLSNATSSNGVPYRAMARVIQYLPFDAVAGGFVDLPSAAMLNVQQSKSTAAEFHGDQFKALIVAEANPKTTFNCNFCTGGFAVVGQGGTANDGFYTSNSDLLTVRDSTGSLVQTGTMTYGSPANANLLGDWGEIGLVSWFGSVRYQVPGATSATPNGLLSGVQMTALATEFAAPRALVPTLSFARHLQIDGVNGMSDQTLASLTPVVTRDPPATGTPTRYAIVVVELVASGAQTQMRNVAFISTPHTSFQILPGILQSGHYYAFHVFDWDAPDQTNAPFRTVLNATFAATPSGLLTAP
jgi:hypothetical protein